MAFFIKPRSYCVLPHNVVEFSLFQVDKFISKLLEESPRVLKCWFQLMYRERTNWFLVNIQRDPKMGRDLTLCFRVMQDLFIQLHLVLSEISSCLLHQTQQVCFLTSISSHFLFHFCQSLNCISAVRLWSTKLNANLVCYKGHNYPVWDVQVGIWWLIILRIKYFWIYCICKPFEVMTVLMVYLIKHSLVFTASPKPG